MNLRKDVITIGVPCHRDVSPSWAYAFRIMGIPFESYQLLVPQGMLVDEARNYIVDNMKGDWLFFLDSDVIPPQDVLEKLLAHDKPIVSGLYFQRNPPFYPHIYKKSDAPGRWDSKMFYKKEVEKNGTPLLKVDSAGLGCCLIKREVFDKIGTVEKDKPRPWFYFTTGYGERQRESEDHYFFRRAAEEGYEIFCDTSVVCGHVSHDIITERHFDAMYEDRFPNKPTLP